MVDESAKKRAIKKLCEGIFATSNLIGTDFDDMQVFEVVKRDFPQQIGGGGLHISFSISWHAIGKTGELTHEALEVLLPAEDEAGP
jgi:hypothetical protein